MLTRLFSRKVKRRRRGVSDGSSETWCEHGSRCCQLCNPSLYQKQRAAIRNGSSRKSRPVENAHYLAAHLAAEGFLNIDLDELAASVPSDAPTWVKERIETKAVDSDATPPPQVTPERDTHEARETRQCVSKQVTVAGLRGYTTVSTKSIVHLAGEIDTLAGNPPVPDADILILSDFSSIENEVSAIARLDSWLAALPHRHKVVVTKGEHPLLGQSPNGGNVVYLHDDSIDIDGICIFGSGALQSMTHSERCKRLSKIPETTDVLVLQMPVRGILDVELEPATDRRVHLGDTEALLATLSAQPKAVLVGAVRGSRGFSFEDDILFINPRGREGSAIANAISFDFVCRVTEEPLRAFRRPRGSSDERIPISEIIRRRSSVRDAESEEREPEGETSAANHKRRETRLLRRRNSSCNFVGAKALHQTLREGVRPESTASPSLMRYREWSEAALLGQFENATLGLEAVFPSNEKGRSSESTFAFTVFEGDVAELKIDSEFMSDYREAVALCSAALGWEIDAARPTAEADASGEWRMRPGGGQVLLRRMVQSLHLFGEDARVASLRHFAQVLQADGVQLKPEVAEAVFTRH